MEASVKAQEVKKPKVVWRRVRALCILTFGGLGCMRAVVVVGGRVRGGRGEEERREGRGEVTA